MPKTFVKYLTKPSEEACAYIGKFNGMSADICYKEIKDFLNVRSNLILLNYEFKKLVGLTFLCVEDRGRNLSCYKIYADKPDNIVTIVYALAGKFPTYKLSFDITKLDKKYHGEIKKRATEISEDNLIYSINL